MSDASKIATGIIAVVIICAAGFIILNKSGDNANDTPIPIINKTGTVIVEVNSNHVMFSADYTLYIDGQATNQFTLSPLQGYKFTKSITLPVGANSKEIKVEVRSTGGGLGGDYDSKTVTVYANNTSTVKLSA